MIPFLPFLLGRFPILGKLPWRLIGAIGIAVALLIVAWRIHHAGVMSERARVTALWQADTAKRDKATQDAIDAAQKREQDAIKHNAEVENDYLAKLDAIERSRDQYVGLLQRARDQVRAAASHEATSLSIAAQAGEAGRAERIKRSLERVERATERVVPESTATADQLDALIAEIKPQL
jgi:hypothetical protein